MSRRILVLAIPSSQTYSKIVAQLSDDILPSLNIHAANSQCNEAYHWSATISRAGTMLACRHGKCYRANALPTKQTGHRTVVGY
jgi:hypothetical protein